ncbi:MAG: teichoic acid biosynthesis protein [Myxococcales bacterium]|nr:teichoic acid biosynthesis protein [Myxococcales bacterium]
MRILYGVVGEGMGHATRSRVVLQHLVAAGHDVHIMVSGRAHDMLARHFEDVHRIHGWHLVYEDNEVKKARTLFSNLEALAAGLPRNVAAYFALIDAFQPEVVISDFESWTWLYGQLHRVPVVSIDNMQIINRCTHPDPVLEGHRNEFLLSKGIVKSKLPGCERYLVTTFFWPEVRKARTTLVPPILRPEVLAARPSIGDHVLVYQSGDDAPTLEAVLKGCPSQPFFVYGLRRGIASEEVDANLRHQPFSEAGFIAHLASAQAVVAGGGFSLMSEAVYLHKPMLSVPLAGQFEQILNARWLERLGFGLCRETIEAEAVAELLGRRDELARRLQTYTQEGNQALFAALDAELAAVGAG